MLSSAIFQEITIGKTVIPNRLAVAPMTRVSALQDGTIGSLMKDYYTRFASGGFGLIITEGLYTDKRYSQGYKNQPGLACDEQVTGWSSIVQSIHSNGARVVAQLMHAGALSQHNNYSAVTAGPSAVLPLGEKMAFYQGCGPFSRPIKMTVRDIEDALDGFVSAASRAQKSGFDGVEIHAANGYLLDQFLTVYTNRRGDSYGSRLENRTKIVREVIEAVKREVGPEFMVGVRFSQKKVNDSEYLWPEKELAARHIFSLAAESGADYIHTSEPLLNASAFDKGPPLSSLAKQYSGLPVIANGGVVSPAAAEQSILSEESDIVALGKIALANQDWPNKVKEDRNIEEFEFAMLNPKANLSNAEEYFRSKYSKHYSPRT